jgi:nucleoside-diphosphate kinase
MANERTLILVKPDGVQRAVVGEVISRIERKGFTLVALQLRTLSVEIAQQHYGEHEGKPFFDDLVEFITSGPLVAGVIEGESAIAAWRTMMGATKPVDATPGSIRADLATEMGRNIVHGSDSPESAAREIALFFPELSG